MINYHENIVALLEQVGLPVYYEAFVTEELLPCISYKEYKNSDYLTGDTLEYSELGFQIKFWTKDIQEGSINCNIIDALLKANGFKRVMREELFIDGVLSLILRYTAIGIEHK